MWCKRNNLILNKTKEMILDFCETGTIPPPLNINRAAVEMVPCFNYLEYISPATFPGLTTPQASPKMLISACTSWGNWRGAGLNTRILSPFHRCVVESILTSSITVWCRNVCTKNHWLQLTIHRRRLHQQAQGQGSLHHERLHPPCI